MTRQTTVEEAKDLKLQLETDIRSMVLEFKAVTGLIIKDIDLHYIEGPISFGGHRDMELIAANIKCELL